MRAILPALILVPATLAPAAAAGIGPSDIHVNTTADLRDATPPGDGVIDVDLNEPGEQISLRAAIEETNATPGADVIVLPAGVFKLKLAELEDGEELAARGDLDVRDELTIRGAGADQTIIDGKKANDRVFHVHGVRFELVDVTVRKGFAKDFIGRGGGIFAAVESDLVVTRCIIKSNRSKDDGGGIAMFGATGVIEETVVAKNKAKDDGGGLDISGGSATLTRVTIHGNKAKDEGGGLELSQTAVTLTNSTIYKNRAKLGGAINLESGGDHVIQSCTVARNVAKQGAGIHEVTDTSHEVLIGGSIFAHNVNKKGKPRNYSGDGVDSSGHNIDDGDSFGFDHATDMTGTNPRLAKKIKNNGGPTPTIALKTDSPAIDAGDDATAPSTDQRGVPRQDVPGAGTSTADIGAFEFEPTT